ncbi:MAG TPA: hypothetical protein VGA10_00845 [Thermoanaerobaculia bacterium]
MANGLLFYVVESNRGTILIGEAHLQFTIESRKLTQPESARGESRSTVIEAADRDAALWEFVRRNASQLVSFATPVRGRESIATVRKDDTVYLVRVYEA